MQGKTQCTIYCIYISIYIYISGYCFLRGRSDGTHQAALRISCSTRNSKVTPKVGFGVYMLLGLEFMFVSTTTSTMDCRQWTNGHVHGQHEVYLESGRRLLKLGWSEKNGLVQAWRCDVVLAELNSKLICPPATMSVMDSQQWSWFIMDWSWLIAFNDDIEKCAQLSLQP